MGTDPQNTRAYTAWRGDLPAPTAVRIALATELGGPADEGMRVWLRQFRRALGASGCIVIDVPLTGAERFSVVDPRNLARLAASKPDVIQYVPFSGLTPASLVRLRILGLAAPRA